MVYQCGYLYAFLFSRQSLLSSYWLGLAGGGGGFVQCKGGLLMDFLQLEADFAAGRFPAMQGRTSFGGGILLPGGSPVKKNILQIGAFAISLLSSLLNIYS